MTDTPRRPRYSSRISESASKRPGCESAITRAPTRIPSEVISGTPAKEAMSVRGPSARLKLGCVAMSAITSEVPVSTPAASVA